MKNFFKKFKSYSFWISLSGAIVLLFNCFGRAFGFKIENRVVEDCIMAIAGFLVMLGIVTMDVDGQDEKEKREEDNNEEKDIDKMNKNTK